MSEHSCEFCSSEAKYAIKWGENLRDKNYSCSEHIRELLASIDARKMWIFKLK